MKYFLDTEFHEYQKEFWTLKGKQKIDTIELISISIVSEDGREYYAICKEFDIKKAWGNEWLRENVLKPIHKELYRKHNAYATQAMYRCSVYIKDAKHGNFTYSSIKYLIKKYGKTKEQIAKEIIEFVAPTNEPQFCKDINGKWDISYQCTKRGGTLPEFYGYYADYDWVVFCWLFGRMIDLPKGFPMFAFDLKQILNEMNNKREIQLKKIGGNSRNVEGCITFPKQTNEHNALADARWNKQLYEFLNNL